MKYHPLMYTLNEFASAWRCLHHPSMDMGGDVAFYYRLYGRLVRTARRVAYSPDDSAVLSLLLYTENIIAIGLDGVYEYRYRSLGDRVVRWCGRLGMDAKGTSLIQRLVSDAVAEAPQSSLRRWMAESVLSGDFLRLQDMLVYFVREDCVLRRVFPDVRRREAMFLRLTGDKQTARQMVWSDLAFNWRDKHGCSISDTLARQFRLLTVPAEEKEKAKLLETAGHLDSIRSERMDTYIVVERKGKRTLALRHRDGRVFEDVIFPFPLAETDKSRCLVAQLVTYLGKTYISGSVRWLGKEEADAWNGGTLWNAIDKEEKEDAKRTYFTTPFGKRLSLYEDLYTLPEDPEEACLASQGIYLNEPNILDFLQWLEPADTAQL